MEWRFRQIKVVPFKLHQSQWQQPWFPRRWQCQHRLSDRVLGWKWQCSSPRSSWVLYVILSNFYNFSQLVNTHPHLFKPLSSYQTFSLYHFLTLSYLLTFCVIYTSYKWTCCTHHRHNSLSCLFVRTVSAQIHLSYSQGVFGRRAILTMGGSDRGWGFPHRTNRYVLAVFALFVLAIWSLVTYLSMNLNDLVGKDLE